MNCKEIIEKATEYMRKKLGWYSDAGKFENDLTPEQSLELYNILLEGLDKEDIEIYKAEIRN